MRPDGIRTECSATPFWLLRALPIQTRLERLATRSKQPSGGCAQRTRTTAYAWHMPISEDRLRSYEGCASALLTAQSSCGSAGVGRMRW